MATSSTTAKLRPECQLDLHSWCKTGEVRTCYGDLVFTIRCDCPCHNEDRR